MAAFKPTDYEVGWICPAPQVNVSKVGQLLDELHAPIAFTPAARHHYIFGTMCGHRTVVACLKNRGMVAAASLVAEMKSLFPHLRFVLLVGVGVGIPNTGHDLRLGDVVIGVPAEQHGGVIAYAHGKAVAPGRIEHMGSLDNPPFALLCAAGTVYGIGAKPDGFTRYFEQTSRDAPPARQLKRVAPNYPPKPRPCKCAEREDQARNGLTPRVHHGVILSADRGIENASTRAGVAQYWPGATLIEQEAAGVVNFMPTLVVQGVGSFGDRDQADLWQIPAAAAAASFGKELLRNVLPHSAVTGPKYHHVGMVPVVSEHVPRSSGFKSLFKRSVK